MPTPTSSVFIPLAHPRHRGLACLPAPERVWIFYSTHACGLFKLYARVRSKCSSPRSVGPGEQGTRDDERMHGKGFGKRHSIDPSERVNRIIEHSR